MLKRLAAGTVTAMSVLALAVWAFAQSAPTGTAPAGSSPPPGGKTMTLDLGGGTTLEVVEIPAGEFVMGSPESEKERDDNEAQHPVKIAKPFYMGTCELTNAQFRAFRPEHHSGWMDGDNQPALWVSWYDAMEFCKWLSGKSGKAVRLPTEAQWEYACRSGSKTRFCSGDSVSGVMVSADLAKVAWYGATSGGKSHEVGKLPANAFGLHDMHGNAWEWCADWFAGDYYKNSPAEDPKGPDSGVARVLRGGCYFYWSNRYCRAAHRYRYRPEARESVIGFRVVVDSPSQGAAFPAFGRQPEEPSRPGPYGVNTPAEKYVARAFGLPVATVPLVTDAPSIDGKLDDPCWVKAAPIGLRYLTGQAGAPTQAATARMVSDARNL